MTGKRGYFGKAGSVLERSQSENRDPRVLAITRWWRQRSQSPEGGDGMAGSMWHAKGSARKGV